MVDTGVNLTGDVQQACARRRLNGEPDIIGINSPTHH
jgi:hypothetical protein